MALATSGLIAHELSTAPVVQGQNRPQGTVEERAKRQADALNATAQLSPDQYGKVLEIKKSTISQREALRNGGGQGDDLKAKFKALGDQEDKQLKAVLTPDQYTKYLAAKEAHHDHGGGR